MRIEPTGWGVSREFEPHVASLRTTGRMQAHWLASMADSPQHLSVSQCIKNLKAIYRVVCGFYSMMRQI